MKRVECNKQFITRHKLANPYPKETLEQRLKEARVVDLNDNHTIEDLGNGYYEIKPIDKNKIYT